MNASVNFGQLYRWKKTFNICQSRDINVVTSLISSVDDTSLFLSVYSKHSMVYALEDIGSLMSTFAHEFSRWENIPSIRYWWGADKRSQICCSLFKSSLKINQLLLWHGVLRPRSSVGRPFKCLLSSSRTTCQSLWWIPCWNLRTTETEEATVDTTA